MLDLAFLTLVLFLTGYAAYLDLLTSEVPDAISLALIGISMLYYGWLALATPAHIVEQLLFVVAAVPVLLVLVAGAIRDAAPRIDRLLDAASIDSLPYPPFESALRSAAILAGYALLRGLIAGTAAPLLRSLLVGTALFAIGWTMYRAGMWGGADAFVLGAVGFAVPSLPPAMAPAAPWPFPVSLVMTVLVVGGVYSMGYAVYQGLREPAVFAALGAWLRTNRRGIAGITVGYGAVAAVAAVVLADRVPVAATAVAGGLAALYLVAAGIAVLSRFLRAVEQQAMHREIPVEDLVAGDVLAEQMELAATGQVEEDPVEDLTDRMVSPLTRRLPTPSLRERYGTRVVGLTEAQVAEIRERRDAVAVKSGVRFIVAFPAAILLLILVGDPIYLLATAL